MASRDDTPPTQGPSPDPTSPSATPSPSTDSTTNMSAPVPAPVTPGGRQRTLPPKTPRTRKSPFTARVPRTPSNYTPGGIVKDCTDNDSLYDIVRVHTAKCTQCDQRNMEIMRRCPGCTFQICTPCYEKRQETGGTLVHGGMEPNGKAPTPGSEQKRVIRRKPFGSAMPSSTSNLQDEIKKENEEMRKNDDSNETIDEAMVGKLEEKPLAIPESSGKKRPIRKKPIVEDRALEESFDNDFNPDPSPTPSKRRRGEPAFKSLPSAATTPVKRSTRKPIATFTAPAYRGPASSRAETTHSLFSSIGFRPSQVEGDPLLYDKAIKGYDEPLLGRRTPVVSDPFIQIPKRVKSWSISERKQADDDGYHNTVRAFVETEAARYRDDDRMDRDESESLYGAMRERARLWGNEVHATLDFAAKNLVRDGLKMRLDKIDEAYKAKLAAVIRECAAQKLKEFENGAVPVPERLSKEQ